MSEEKPTTAQDNPQDADPTAAPAHPGTASSEPASPDTATPPPVPAGSGGFDLSVVIAQAKQVVTDPRTFYRNMPKGGGFSEPVIFLLVMALASGLIFTVLSLIGLTGAGAAGIGAIIMMPVAMLIGGFIGAAILFVIWKLMGSPENYETAYRCFAYSTAIFPIVSVLSIIPYLGTLVRVVWSVWLMIIASVEVQGRAVKTAQIVFGILGALSLISSLGAESAQRNLQDEAAVFEERMQSLQGLGINEDGEVDPEQAGRAMGEFMKGMEEAMQRAEEAAE